MSNLLSSNSTVADCSTVTLCGLWSTGNGMLNKFFIYFSLTFALNFGMQSPRVLSVPSIVGLYWDAMPQVIVRQASAVRLSRGEAH